MKLTGARAAALAALVAPLAACVAVDHNIPSDPISDGSTGRIALYADANGHLYPDDWNPPYERRQIEKRHSLLGSFNFDRDVHLRLRRDREKQLDEVAARLAGASRVFLLVHGFNNTQSEARVAFDAVRSRLALGPADRVVEFHWDGLSSKKRAGQAKMWFNAVAYSQMAGTQALRGLIRRLPDTDMVVIAHSRGTSVTLSALSDPSYRRKFRRKTERLLTYGDASDFGSPELPEGRGRIDLIFLASAIGKPDFWRPRNRGEGCEAYRAFPRLRSLHYAVNRNDPVLKKVLRPLASKFNATDLGLDPAVGEELEPCYPDIMTGHPVEPPMHSHRFVDYVANPVFPRMLAAAGVQPAP